MHLPLRIAGRYLFARKSHNVINIISLISAIGIAIGTCALIIVLSVYNGFEEIVKSIYHNAEADLVITPVKGKFFFPSTAAFQTIKSDSRILSIAEVVQENVFISYDGHQGVGLIKGVDSIYESDIDIKSCLVEGSFKLYDGQIAQAIVGRTLAQNMKIRPRFLDPLEIYFPKRGESVSMTNPLSSLRKESLFVVGVISIEQNIDKEVVFLPIDVARRLLDFTDEVTSLEIKVRNQGDIDVLQKSFSKILGDDYEIKDRYRQNETVYKMMTYEKVAIYMILLFIIIIISCNVFGSLTMLIIEKKNDIGTLNSMGANKKLVRTIFVEEGWLITLYGIAFGVVLGMILCFIQQYFGVIKMPGNFVITAYPIIIQWTDVILTVLIVSLIGFIISSIPAWKTLPKIYEELEKGQ